MNRVSELPTIVFVLGIPAYRRQFCSRKLFGEFSYGEERPIIWAVASNGWLHFSLDKSARDGGVLQYQQVALCTLHL